MAEERSLMKVLREHLDVTAVWTENDFEHAFLRSCDEGTVRATVEEHLLDCGYEIVEGFAQGYLYQAVDKSVLATYTSIPHRGVRVSFFYL